MRIGRICVVAQRSASSWPLAAPLSQERPPCQWKLGSRYDYKAVPIGPPGVQAGLSRPRPPLGTEDGPLLVLDLPLLPCCSACLLSPAKGDLPSLSGSSHRAARDLSATVRNWALGRRTRPLPGDALSGGQAVCSGCLRFERACQGGVVLADAAIDMSTLAFVHGTAD